MVTQNVNVLRTELTDVSFKISIKKRAWNYNVNCAIDKGICRFVSNQHVMRIIGADPIVIILNNIIYPISPIPGLTSVDTYLTMKSDLL